MTRLAEPPASPTWPSTFESGQRIPLGALVTHEGGAVTVVVRGELDLASAPTLQRQVLGLLALPIESISLDLGGLEFMDSSGLNALDAMRGAAVERKLPFFLAAVPRCVQQVLDTTDMASRFPVR